MLTSWFWYSITPALYHLPRMHRASVCRHERWQKVIHDTPHSRDHRWRLSAVSRVLVGSERGLVFYTVSAGLGHPHNDNSFNYICLLFCSFNYTVCSPFVSYFAQQSLFCNHRDHISTRVHMELVGSDKNTFVNTLGPIGCSLMWRMCLLYFNAYHLKSNCLRDGKNDASATTLRIHDMYKFSFVINFIITNSLKRTMNHQILSRVVLMEGVSWLVNILNTTFYGAGIWPLFVLQT